ncbi:hypothetical protein [Piscirickettsia litoralis]|uniref:Regulatory protein RecX n=1 Tax=Piscirickettsia litoralis TaxID=1891921 RepID=A0ABX2ZXX7_9GAMM|nr:hypothetical protein [Piscirickettsia litoralis]ODN41055.1 hypothetical protein BGC07_18070 [Piscirickettsia litoralis]
MLFEELNFHDLLLLMKLKKAKEGLVVVADLAKSDLNLATENYGRLGQTSASIVRLAKEAFNASNHLNESMTHLSNIFKDIERMSIAENEPKQVIAEAVRKNRDKLEIDQRFMDSYQKTAYENTLNSLIGHLVDPESVSSLKLDDDRKAQAHILSAFKSKVIGERKRAHDALIEAGFNPDQDRINLLKFLTSEEGEALLGEDFENYIFL